MEFKMHDLVWMLRLPTPPQNHDSYYINCPFCDFENGRHLNINFRKDVFRCAKCGTGGGVLDLYSILTGVPREKAWEDIKTRNPEKTYSKPIFREENGEASNEYPLTDIDTRHETYSNFLQKLTLADDHRENLRNRGLKDDEICICQYRTTPVIGTKFIARQLNLSGCCLSGVPGFFKDEHGEWDFCYAGRGILIPVRNVDGKIQGLQLRLDNTQNRKFRWISSAERLDGCKAETWCHLAGTKFDEIILTEGPMKGDVIHSLTGKTVLSVPGVNSLSALRVVLTSLIERGLERIMIAFDMDFLSNDSVHKGFTSLLDLLDEMDILYGTYLWNPSYKGLDDYVNHIANR